MDIGATEAALENHLNREEEVAPERCNECGAYHLPSDMYILRNWKREKKGFICKDCANKIQEAIAESYRCKHLWYTSRENKGILRCWNCALEFSQEELSNIIDRRLSKKIEQGKCAGCDELTTRREYGSFVCDDCEQESIKEIWANPLDD